MPSASVELVSRWVDAFNGRDVADFVELWDSDCEYFTLTGSQLAGAPYRGHAGVWRYCEERAEIWDELRLERDELRELEGVVVMLGRMCGRGKESGLELEHEMALVFEIRDGRVLRVRSYWNPADALADLGLAR